MKNGFLVFFFCLFCKAALAQKDSIAFVGKSQIYMDGRNHYRITFPNDWRRNLEDVQQVVFMGAPIDSGYFKSDGSFGINVSKIPNGYTTKDAMNSTLKNIEKEPLYTNFKITEQKSILIDGKTFEYVIFQVEARSIVLTFLQFYLVYKNTFYILGGSLPSSTMGKYRNIYFDIAKSFQLSK